MTAIFHDKLIPSYLERIFDLVADAGWTNLICFSGNRRGMDDELGLQNSVKGLKAILSHAEKSRGNFTHGAFELQGRSQRLYV